MRRPSGRGRRPSCGKRLKFQVIVSVDQAEKLGETFGIEVAELHGRFQMAIQTAGT
jgi:hypothetical protein